jgi:hypothetical protein
MDGVVGEVEESWAGGVAARARSPSLGGVSRV